MFADGGAFTNGIVSTPTAFGMADGQAGVMGEAGPEAIMPLARAPDGSLGVRAVGFAPAGGGAAVESSMSVGGITQHIHVQGTADNATLARIQQAARQGAQDGYNLVLRDFKTNGPARQLMARNR